MIPFIDMELEPATYQDFHFQERLWCWLAKSSILKADGALILIIKKIINSLKSYCLDINSYFSAWLYKHSLSEREFQCCLTFKAASKPTGYLQAGSLCLYRSVSNNKTIYNKACKKKEPVSCTTKTISCSSAAKCYSARKCRRQKVSAGKVLGAKTSTSKSWWSALWNTVPTQQRKYYTKKIILATIISIT